MTLAQVFSCEICEIFRNTYFEEHLRTADSANTPVFHIFSSSSVLMKPINKDSKSNTPQWVFFKFFKLHRKVPNRAKRLICIYNCFFACISKQSDVKICRHKHFEAVQIAHSNHRFFSCILFASIMEASIYFSSLSCDCSFFITVLESCIHVFYVRHHKMI